MFDRKKYPKGEKTQGTHLSSSQTSFKHTTKYIHTQKKQSEKRIAAIESNIKKEMMERKRNTTNRVQRSHVLSTMISPGRSSSSESVSRSVHRPLTLSEQELDVLSKYRRKLGRATKYIREAIRGRCIEKAPSKSKTATAQQPQHQEEQPTPTK